MSFDDQEKSVKLSLRQAEILEQLAKDEELLKQGGGVPDLAVGSCKCEFQSLRLLMSEELTKFQG